jgi:Uma2 family endonuclease
MDIDVLLEDDPPTVRAPDVAVLPASAVHDGRRITAADVSLAVEFVSPGSRRSDRVTKLAEYAEAGIPNYWIIDLAASDDSRFTAFRLEQGSYTRTLQSEGAVRLGEPAPIEFRLADLTARRRR